MRKCKSQGRAPKAENETRAAPKARKMKARAAAKPRNMKARGKREAQRNASPLVTRNNFEQSTESAKYKCQLFRSYRASRPSRTYDQGRRASRCSALAPGFHIPRLRRLPLAFIFRAFGAASPYIFRAFGAGRS